MSKQSDSALVTASVEEMAERLVRRCHLWGRVLQRHHQLCRQGRGALFLL